MIVNNMEYNDKCPCCNWKFYVDPNYKGERRCVKCGSIWLVNI